MRRTWCVLGSLALAACSPSHGTTSHSCAEAAAMLPGHAASCPLTSGCATELACDGWTDHCAVDLGGCGLDAIACVDGHVMTFDTGDGGCDASIERDAGHDASPIVDANVDAVVIETPFEDGGGVHTCDQAQAMLGAHPCLSSGVDCDAGFDCDGFDTCVVCPYVVTCDRYHHQVTISEATFPCDAGP